MRVSDFTPTRIKTFHIHTKGKGRITLVYRRNGSEHVRISFRKIYYWKMEENHGRSRFANNLVYRFKYSDGLNLANYMENE